MDRSSTLNSITGRSTSTPIRFLTDPRLDFAVPASLQKSYIVASSDRYSSASVCKSLWKTGRLGAPWEYLNASFEDVRGTLAAPADHSIASTMMKRLQALGPSEYIAELLACRTSSNGVFGLNARFDDFELAVEASPGIVEHAGARDVHLCRLPRQTGAGRVRGQSAAGGQRSCRLGRHAGRPAAALRPGSDLKIPRQARTTATQTGGDGSKPTASNRSWSIMTTRMPTLPASIRAVAELLDVRNDAADKVDFPRVRAGAR